MIFISFVISLAWLEASFQEELDSTNPQHEEHARNLIIAMVQQLETKAAESTDFLTKTKLEEVISSIKVNITTIYVNNDLEQLVGVHSFFSSKKE